MCNCLQETSGALALERGEITSKPAREGDSLCPFQCHKALFVCQNSEEAKKIAELGSFSISDYPDVMLSGWWQVLNQAIKRRLVTVVGLLLRDCRHISGQTIGFRRLVMLAVVWWKLIIELQNLSICLKHWFYSRVC